MPPCPAPDTCWLYLLRHGATANNLARPPRLQGQRVDLPLSPDGRVQAQRTSAWLADRHVDAVYASPLARARETAAAIAQPHGLAVQTVAELVEIDVGQWEEMAWDEIARTAPQAYHLFKADPSIHPYLGGENLTMVRDRVVPAFAALLAGNLGRTIVVVAHNMVNRCYLADLLQIPLAQYRNVMQDNCGVTLLQHHAGETRAVTINSLWHLDGA